MACRPGPFFLCGISLHGLDGRICNTCADFSGSSGQVPSFSMSTCSLLPSLSPESTRPTFVIGSIRVLSSSVSGIASNCFGIGFRGSYIVGGRLRCTGGTRASYPWPMPSAEAVGSNEQLSFARARRQACTIAVIVVLMRIKHPAPAVTTRPLLSGIIMTNIVRSAESDVSRRVLLKALRLIAKLSKQPNPTAMPLMERSSSGTRTDPGISRLRSTNDSMTKRLVRNTDDA